MKLEKAKINAEQIRLGQLVKHRYDLDESAWPERHCTELIYYKRGMFTGKKVCAVKIYADNIEVHGYGRPKTVMEIAALAETVFKLETSVTFIEDEPESFSTGGGGY